MKREKVIRRHSLRMKMMGINVAIALSSFLLCGLLFVMAITNMVGKYVNHDLDFFLTETSSNLNARLEYMEDALSRVRKSGEIMSWLANTDETSKDTDSTEFKKVLDISHSKNQGNDGKPVIEKVYLFRNDGSYLSDFYYAMVYSEVDESNLGFQQIWKEYRNADQEPGHARWYGKDDEKGYLAYPVLDDRMNEKGVFIFEVNLTAVENVMAEITGYEEAFWILYHEDTMIDGENTEGVKESIHQFLEREDVKPYISQVSGIKYKIYSRDLCLNLRVTAGIPKDQALVMLYGSVGIYVAGIVVILFAGLLSFGIFSYKITKPMKEVTDKLEQVRKGDFETKLPDYPDTEFHEISGVFNQMTEQINHLVNQVYEKQIAVKEMELKFLQTQMNPHFMFNVLNAISLQAKIDGNEEISQTISTFSRLIQAKIYRSESEKVQIRQELEYVKYYLEIQQFRYGERLSYHIEVEDEQVLDAYIPKLAVQMIAENAIVHGLEPKTGDGRVEIRIGRQEDDVIIEVMDDGVGFDCDGVVELPLKSKTVDESHNHVGLNNVHHIIKLMYGEEYGITVISKRNQGTCAKIRIPFDFYKVNING